METLNIDTAAFLNIGFSLYACGYVWLSTYWKHLSAAGG